LYKINRLVLTTELESVYCAVRTQSLYKTNRFFSLSKVQTITAL